MGHRDGINVAMKTYHSDIGSRLSNLYLPTSPGHELGKHSLTDFRFLTINPRHDNIRPQVVQLSLIKSQTRNKLKLLCSGKSAPKPKALHLAEDSITCSKAPSVGNISPNTSNNPQLPQREKLTLKQRLTRVLFHKKHVCCRCTRKSSECVPNKTFNGIEKHYTCSRCREASNTVKYLFDSQSNGNLKGNSDSSKQGYMQNKQQKFQIEGGHYKDSGYETVTSCSTVASASSTFTTSFKCNPRAGKDIPALKSAESVTNALDPTTISQYDASRGKSQPNTSNPSIHLNPSSSQASIACKTTADVFYGAHRKEPPDTNFRQIPQRKFKMYDGYLPDVYQNISGHNTNLKLLTDTKHSPVNDLQSRLPKIAESKKVGTNSATRQRACHICDASCKVFFRLPWKGGWVCEDCLDHLH